MAGVERTLAQPRQFTRICVFCGASQGSKPIYMEAAKQLASTLVKHHVGLVYGGGTVGLMGEVARTVVEGLGDDNVIGVIPEALAPREVSGTMIGKQHVVPDMHTRKAMMARFSDGFIALPGGFGTLEELLEVLTWQQLGFHEKPIGLLNMGGFFDTMLAFFDHLVEEGFVRATHRRNLLTSSDPEELLELMRTYQPPPSLISMISSEGAVGVDIRTADHSVPTEKVVRHTAASTDLADV